MSRLLAEFQRAVWLAMPLAGCAWLLTPVNDSPSKDAPCGLHGNVCSGAGPSAMCCGEFEECGCSGPWCHCAPGMCCYTGDDTSTNPNSFGAARKVRPQFQPDGGR